ncbi:hypothetical protein [Sedimenticola selenatireducens]|uniref:hypothetical protein n=1 Tax=Sedimenticola selenatireducens TaxID=191960 RepID=UPI0004BAFEF0|nr:hypothetical protein [Sedimenticola selenatireducens]
MADKNLTLAIRIKAEVDKAIRDLQRSEKEILDQGKAGEKSSKGISKLTGAYTALGAAIGAAFSVATARRLISDFKVQEQAVAGLDASLASMGRTTQGLSGQLQALASQLQGEGIIGDEAIIQGQSFLTTYSKISDDLLPRATRLMVDLAAKMKGDVVGAANMVGKASMGMVGELALVGITFSDETKKSKDFVKILEEMESQVSGVNKKLGETATGGIDQFDMALGDLREQLGEIIALGVSDYLREMKDEMAFSDETVKELGDDLKVLVGHLDEAAIGVSGLLVARIAGPALGSMAANALFASRAMMIMGASATASALKVDALTLSANLAKGALKFLGGPVGVIITAATALAVWKSNSDDAASSTENYSAKLKQLQGDLKGVELAQLQASIAKAEADRERLQQEIKFTSGREFSRLFNKLGDVNRYLNEAKRRAHDLATAAKSTKSGIKGIGEGADEADDSLKKFIDRLTQQRETLGLTADELLRYQTEQAIAAAKDKALADSVRQSTEALIAKRQALREEIAAEEAFEAVVKASEEAVKAENAEYQAWLESLDLAAQAIRDTLDPMEPLRREMEQLDVLLNAGKLSWEEWAAATLNVQERMDELNGKAEETANEMDQFAIQAGRNIQSAFADFLFDPFNEGLDGMLAGFVQTIHRMVSELLAQQILRSFFTSMAGGDPSSIFSTLAAGVHHTGGIAGSGPVRQVSPLAFVNAPRYHSGGIAGIKPDEVPAVLKRGEEVLTPSDPRHRMNQAGGESQASANFRIINSVDPRFVTESMGSAAGEKVIMNVILRNSTGIRQILA